MIVFTRAGVYNNPSVDDIERLFSSIVARFKPFACIIYIYNVVYMVSLYTIYTNHVSTSITWQYVWVNARTSVTKYRAETRRNVRDTMLLHRYFEKKIYRSVYTYIRVNADNFTKYANNEMKANYDRTKLYHYNNFLNY